MHTVIVNTELESKYRITLANMYNKYEKKCPHKLYFDDLWKLYNLSFADCHITCCTNDGSLWV